MCEVIICESELRYIAGLSAASRHKETGGALYGLWTRQGTPVVMYATGPGPHAIHEEAHFAQDISHFRNTDRDLKESFAIEYIGRHHSHHGLGLTEPSGGDVRSLSSLARRNGYSRLVELISTHDNEPEYIRARRRLRAYGRFFPRRHFFSRLLPRVMHILPARYLRQMAPKISIHAYFYTDTGQNPFTKYPMRVVAGVSPIRQAISESCAYSKDVCSQIVFPMGRISYDSTGYAQYLAMPDWLNSEFGDLPERVRELAKVFKREDLLIVKIPLPMKGVLLVAYSPATPRHVASICVDDPSSSTLLDITSSALVHGMTASLSEIYTFAAHNELGEMRTDTGSTEDGPPHKDPLGTDSLDQALEDKEVVPESADSKFRRPF